MRTSEMPYPLRLLLLATIAASVFLLATAVLAVAAAIGIASGRFIVRSRHPTSPLRPFPIVAVVSGIICGWLAGFVAACASAFVSGAVVGAIGISAALASFVFGVRSGVRSLGHDLG